jgi:hypothetical protein
MCHLSTLATICGDMASPQLVGLDITRVRVGASERDEQIHEDLNGMLKGQVHYCSMNIIS